MPEPKFDISYVDRVDVSETFADSIEKINVGNGVWHFEFCVTRLAEPKGATWPGKKYPACRLVLSMNAGIDLINKLQQLKTIMEKQGVLKSIPPPNVFTSPADKPN